MDVEHYGNKFSRSYISKEVRGEFNLGYTTRSQNLKTNALLKDPFYRFEVSGRSLQLVSKLCFPYPFTNPCFTCTLPSTTTPFSPIPASWSNFHPFWRSWNSHPYNLYYPTFLSQVLFLEDLSPVNLYTSRAKEPQSLVFIPDPSSPHASL